MQVVKRSHVNGHSVRGYVVQIEMETIIIYNVNVHVFIDIKLCDICAH
jgi:hypothetical protein